MEQGRTPKKTVASARRGRQPARQPTRKSSRRAKSESEEEEEEIDDEEESEEEVISAPRKRGSAAGTGGRNAATAVASETKKNKKRKDYDDDDDDEDEESEDEEDDGSEEEAKPKRKPASGEKRPGRPPKRTATKKGNFRFINIVKIVINYFVSCVAQLKRQKTAMKKISTWMKKMLSMKKRQARQLSTKFKLLIFKKIFKHLNDIIYNKRVYLQQLTKHFCTYTTNILNFHYINNLSYIKHGSLLFPNGILI